MTDGVNAVWSNDRAAPTDTNPKNLELAPPQSITATRLDQLVYSPNYYIQIFQTQPFARSEDWTLNLHARSYQVQRAYQLRYGIYISFRQEVEAALGKRSLPTDCQRDEKIFRTVLLKAASHQTPWGSCTSRDTGRDEQTRWPP